MTDLGIVSCGSYSVRTCREVCLDPQAQDRGPPWQQAVTVLTSDLSLPDSFCSRVGTAALPCSLRVPRKPLGRGRLPTPPPAPRAGQSSESLRSHAQGAPLGAGCSLWRVAGGLWSGAGGPVGGGERLRRVEVRRSARWRVAKGPWRNRDGAGRAALQTWGPEQVPRCPSPSACPLPREGARAAGAWTWGLGGHVGHLPSRSWGEGSRVPT